MASIFYAPPWFLGIDSIFELAFAVVTILIAWFSFRVYRISRQKSSLFFSYAFAFIAVSYVVESLIHLKIRQSIAAKIILMTTVREIFQLNTIAVLVHVLFMLIGLTLLVCVSCRVTDRRMHSLLMVLMLFLALFAINHLSIFYAISAILLIYINMHMYENYKVKRNRNALLTLIAFLVLFAANITYIFSWNRPWLYATGHMLELLAYIILAITLGLVLLKK